MHGCVTPTRCDVGRDSRCGSSHRDTRLHADHHIDAGNARLYVCPFQDRCGTNRLLAALWGRVQGHCFAIRHAAIKDNATRKDCDNPGI